MKLLILGDTHFGGSFNLGKTCPQRRLNTRLIDNSNTFNYVIDYCVSHKIQTLVITGDVFDHRRPNSYEISLFAEKMARTSDLKIHTHIVIGNHDLSIAQNSTTLDFLDELKLPYVHIHSNIESIVENDLNLIFFPFRTRKMLKCKTNEEAIERLRERLDYEIKPDMTNILVGHFIVEGVNIANSLMDSSIAELVLPLDMFDSLDATIMGHIHPHQIIKKDPLIAYVGSMDRSRFDEGKHKKYFLVIEKEKKLKFNFQTLPVRNLYDITIDQSSADNAESVLAGIKKYLIEFDELSSLKGSILRLQIHLNEKALYGFNIDDVKEYLDELNVFHCVGVFTHITSKRQLRKETITERMEPADAFAEFLDMEEDSSLKNRIRELGNNIISRSLE